MGICLNILYIFLHVISRTGWGLILCTDHRTSMCVEMPMCISGKQWIYCDTKNWLLGLKINNFLCSLLLWQCLIRTLVVTIWYMRKIYSTGFPSFTAVITRIFDIWNFTGDGCTLLVIQLRKPPCKIALYIAEWWMEQGTFKKLKFKKSIYLVGQELTAFFSLSFWEYHPFLCILQVRIYTFFPPLENGQSKMFWLPKYLPFMSG